MKKDFKYWMRWVGVLPISFLASVAILFPVHWVLYRLLNFITPYPELPEEIVGPFFTGLVIVWIASKVAPEYKFKTAVILAVIWIFVAGAGFVLGYLGYNFENFQMKLTAGGLPIFAGVIGAIVGLYFVKKKLSEIQL